MRHRREENIKGKKKRHRQQRQPTQSAESVFILFSSSLRVRASVREEEAAKRAPAKRSFKDFLKLGRVGSLSLSKGGKEKRRGIPSSDSGRVRRHGVYPSQVKPKAWCRGGSRRHHAASSLTASFSVWSTRVMRCYILSGGYKTVGVCVAPAAVADTVRRG